MKRNKKSTLKPNYVLCKVSSGSFWSRCAHLSKKRTRLQRRTLHFLKASHCWAFHKRCTYGIRVAIKCFKMFFFSLLKKFPFSFFPWPFTTVNKRAYIQWFSAVVWDDNNLVSELLDFDCPFKTSFKQKLKTKIKPHLVPLFAKIIINRFRLLNKHKRP